MGPFQFDDDGRTFTCERSSSPATPGTLWWWVNASGDPRRYAAFRAEPRDTRSSVQPRIVAYYAKVLADRERPPAPMSHWGRRPSPTASPAPDTAPIGRK